MKQVSIYTIIALLAIGSWVFVQEQNLAFRNKQLQQTKQLETYRQQQENKRNTQDNCYKIDLRPDSIGTGQECD